MKLFWWPYNWNYPQGCLLLLLTVFFSLDQGDSQTVRRPGQGDLSLDHYLHYQQQVKYASNHQEEKNLLILTLTVASHLPTIYTWSAAERWIFHSHLGMGPEPGNWGWTGSSRGQAGWAGWTGEKEAWHFRNLGFRWLVMNRHSTKKPNLLKK